MPTITFLVCYFYLDWHVVFIQYECWVKSKMSLFVHLKSGVKQFVRQMHLKYSVFIG